MKKMIVLCIFLIAFSSTARDELQFGVILGAPTGLSAKLHLGNNRSIDAALAYSLSHDLSLVFHSDYLIENAYAFHINAPEPLELYFGIGARLANIKKGKNENDLALGPRVPLGVSYTINNPNLIFFGELALILNIVPETNVDLDAGIGARYRF